jgi:hypothetical protein
MKRTNHNKYLTADLYETAAIYLFADTPPELLSDEDARVSFAFPEIPAVIDAARRYRERDKGDLYLFSMLLKKVRGLMIAARDAARGERFHAASFR